MKLQLRYHLGLQSPADLPEAWESVSTLTHITGKLVQVVDWQPQFYSVWAFAQGSEVFLWCDALFLLEWAIQEASIEAAMSFVAYSQKSHTITSSISVIQVTVIWYLKILHKRSKQGPWWMGHIGGWRPQHVRVCSWNMVTPIWRQETF